MKPSIKTICILLAAAIFMASCAGTTLIQSTPPGAEVYVNGMKKGTTPYYYGDTKIVGSMTNITLKKEGYQDLNVNLVRDERVDVGAIVGGIFLFVPFLWTMQYDPIHNYELQPLVKPNPVKDNTQNATNELVKLKALLDQGAITTEDFTTLKSKILNDQYDYSNSIADQIVKLKGLLDADILTQEEYKTQKDKLINGK